MRNAIVVNATALDSRGGLSILRQFVENIPEDDNQWILFISPLVKNLPQKSNVEFATVDNVKGLAKRVCWDSFGLKQLLRKHKIKPVGSISLQNTGFNIGKNIPQIIYYHQPLPFYPYKWNPFCSKERGLWFYKHIYPIFVRHQLKRNTYIIVQLQSIKNEFSQRFKHPIELIGVFSPSIQKSIEKKTVDEFPELSSDNINLFYPASAVFYKNHYVLYESMKLLNSNFNLYVTIDPQGDGVDEDERIIHCGNHSYEWVNAMYHSCDALVFPSYIETYGLPLVEAAMIGLPIIAADLPYAREVLKGYEGASFVKHDEPKEWAKAIRKLKKGEKFKPMDISNRPGWREFFQEVKNIFKLK